MTSDENRFYYLRLMSRKTSSSGLPSAVTKPKFVQWGHVQLFSTSIDDNPDLEVGKYLGFSILGACSLNEVGTRVPINLEYFSKLLDIIDVSLKRYGIS